MTPPPTEAAVPAPRAPGPSARSPALVLLGCVAMIAGVGVADHLAGPDVELALFYLAPVGLGTWYAHPRGGLFLSGCAALAAAAADALDRASVGGAALSPGALAWNALMHAGTALSIVLVLAALRGRLEAQERLARTDALTEIANRRAFFEMAALEVERARRHGRPLTAAYVDCDDFKDVNDRLGHTEGDALLVAAAQTLRGATRAVDLVARLGGDEFGLLLPETNAAEAEALLARVQRTLLAAMARHGWRVGFSIGAATFLAPPASVDELMARADELMYAAKRERKGSMRLGVFPRQDGAHDALPSP